MSCNIRNNWYKVNNPRCCKTFNITNFKFVIFGYDKLWQFRENLRRMQGAKP